MEAEPSIDMRLWVSAAGPASNDIRMPEAAPRARRFQGAES
jgi:hypothetical protein